MKLSNVESDSRELAKRFKKNHGATYDSKRRDTSGIFLVIDEFAALRIALDKKILQKSMTV